jgi:pimeloyl-ACP methyl ester carboxylesterase
MSADDQEPTCIEFRSTKHNQAAIVFVHGFGGHAAKTWAGFPDFLKAEPRLAGWDLFGLGYPSQTLRIDVPGIWAADPDLAKLAVRLRTSLSLTPFDRYRSLVVHPLNQ